MIIYTALLTIHCRCGFRVENQEMEFVREPWGEIVKEKHLPKLPSKFVEGKKREVLEIGTWVLDSRLHHLDCPKCGLILDCCPGCNTFNDFEFIEPDGMGTSDNMRCRICKRSKVQCQ